MFDTHVNLHADAYAEDLPDVLSRAREAGVSRMLAICERLDSFPKVKAIADANAGCTVCPDTELARDARVLK